MLIRNTIEQVRLWYNNKINFVTMEAALVRRKKIIIHIQIKSFVGRDYLRL